MNLVEAPGRRLREDPVLPERLLAKLWRAKTGATLQTTDGRSVRVLYPGRPAPGHGPDFRDAVLELDGHALNGPVELHRVPNDWAIHGHHRDRAYDNVVLHVVAASPETPSMTTTISPAPRPAALDPRVPELPTVVLPAGRPDPTTESPGAKKLLGDLAVLDDVALRARLRTAGMVRFGERVADAAVTIDARGVEQALLTGIMDGLGYAENRAGFAELARRVPFAVLQATARSAPAPGRTALLTDLLLCGSGLGSPTRAWVQFIGTPPMDPTAWRTSGVRPSNHPRRRLAALASYLASAECGLAAWLGPHALAGPRVLVRALCVESDARAVGAALVGESRAIEIAVNAVLPILVADAHRRDDTPAAIGLYQAYERCTAPPPNTVVREALRLLGHQGRLTLGACEQQGLMRCYQRAVASYPPAAS
jgi:hypothetical protein